MKFPDDRYWIGARLGLFSAGLAHAVLGAVSNHPFVAAAGAAAATFAAGTSKGLGGPDSASRLKQAEELSLAKEREAGLVFDLVGSLEFADPEQDCVFKLWPGYWNWHQIVDDGPDLYPGREYWAIHMLSTNTAFWVNPEKLCYLEAVEESEKNQKHYEDSKKPPTGPDPKGTVSEPIHYPCYKCGGLDFEFYNYDRGNEVQLKCCNCGLLRRTDVSATDLECPKSPSGFHLFGDDGPFCKYCHCHP